MKMLDGKTVILSRCPLCRGVKLYAFEEFMDADDAAELKRLAALGFETKRFPFRGSISASECNCQEAKVAGAARERSASGKPRLTLKRPAGE